MGVDPLRLTIEQDIDDCTTELLALEKDPKRSRSTEEILLLKQRLFNLCAALAHLGDNG